MKPVFTRSKPHVYDAAPPAPKPLDELLAAWESWPARKADVADEMARRLRMVAKRHHWHLKTEVHMDGSKRRCSCGSLECYDARALNGESE